MPLSLASIQYISDFDSSALVDNMQFLCEPNTATSNSDFDGSYKLLIGDELPTSSTKMVKVYLGYLVEPEADEADEALHGDLVVVKVALASFFDQLVTEAKFYAAHLNEAAERSLVPACHGVHTVVHPTTGREKTGFLILDCVGSNLVAEWDDLMRDDDYKKRLIATVMDLHNYGIFHKDISARHFTFLQDSGQGDVGSYEEGGNSRNESDNSKGLPFIIDFSQAEAGQNCSCQGRSVESLQWGGIEIKKSDFGCDELWDFCQSLQMWSPRLFLFGGVKIPLSDLRDMESVARAKKTTTDWDAALEAAYIEADKWLTKNHPGSEEANLVRAMIEDPAELHARCADFKTRMDAEGPFVEPPIDN